MKWFAIISILAASAGFVIITALNVEHNALVIWAVVATIAVPAALIVGWILGGLEARGKISGIDVAADRFTGSWERIAKATADVERKRPQPTVQVYNAAGNDVLPPISHRSLPGPEEDIIDL